MISKATIDTVYETARVEEVIGDFVQLKRAGSNYKGLSPFSDERSPSFMVSPAKGIWKPGPQFKPALEAAFESQLDGAFYDEAGGLEWMRNYLRAHPPVLSSPSTSTP